MKKNCRHLIKSTKCVITKNGVMYGTMYKCELKSEQKVASIKLACRRCPKQLDLFDDEMDNKRLNR